MKASRLARVLGVLAAGAVFLMVQPAACAQGGRGGGAPQTAKAASPMDLAGYWVSVITQAWRLRMVIPPRGDYLGIAVNPEAKKVADAWDPAKEEAAGNACKGYGAAIIMEMPERLHITWPDENTLQMEIDAGTQTRTFHFGKWAPPEVKPSWQGDSVASWESRERDPRRDPKARYLQVNTNHLLGGFLRKNGVPYSENATIMETYDFFQEPTGEQWMIVTTTVTDPKYLARPLLVTAQFRKQADPSGWDPTPCSATW
jgi:hypothetical protein